MTTILRPLLVVNMFLATSELSKEAGVGGYHCSLFHYFTSTYPVQFKHFLLNKPQSGCYH